MQNKMALKVVQNGQITMKDCRVPEANRLAAGAQSFRDTARVLRGTRYYVGWEATGCQMGAYEHALKYAQERLQFGTPIGSFQLIQDFLAKMLGNITACQCMVVRTAQLAVEGKLTDQQAALAKRSRWPKRVRRSPGRESCWAATASSSTTALRASSRMPRPSIPTKARIRCKT